MNYFFIGDRVDGNGKIRGASIISLKDENDTTCMYLADGSESMNVEFENCDIENGDIVSIKARFYRVKHLNLIDQNDAIKEDI